MTEVEVKIVTNIVIAVIETGIETVDIVTGVMIGNVGPAVGTVTKDIHIAGISDDLIVVTEGGLDQETDIDHVLETVIVNEGLDLETEVTGMEGDQGQEIANDQGPDQKIKVTEKENLTNVVIGVALETEGAGKHHLKET